MENVIQAMHTGNNYETELVGDININPNTPWKHMLRIIDTV